MPAEKKKFFKERIFSLLDEIFAAIIISTFGFVIIKFRIKIIHFFNNIFEGITGINITILIPIILSVLFVLIGILIWRIRFKFVPKKFRRDWDVPIKERGKKRNPFIVGSPVFGANFYGRKDEINKIYDLLSRSQSCSIISNRRVGKTSLLLQIAHEKTLKEIGKKYGLNSRKTIFIYLSTSSFENEDQFWRGLCYKLAEHISISANYDPAKKVDFHDFSDLLKEANNKGLSIRLLFDEFEETIMQMKKQFFEQLRECPGQFDVAYVVVTLKSLWEYIELDSEISSPFPNIFQQIELGLFSEEEARDMLLKIFKGAGFTPVQQDTEFLLDLAGPHPFFLQMAGDTFFNIYVSPPKRKLPLPNKPKIFREIEKRFYSSAKPFFKYYFNKLDSDEKEALINLTHEKSHNINHEIINRLKQRVLIKRQGNKFIPFSRSFKNFLLNNAINLKDDSTNINDNNNKKNNQ